MWGLVMIVLAAWIGGWPVLARLHARDVARTEAEGSIGGSFFVP